MATWADLEAAEPAFAARVRERLDAHVHKTLATLRADGSPRISGIETFFAAGDLWIGSMPDARKARDLLRDPRFALHSGSADPPAWAGDAKLAGTMEEVGDPGRREEIFRARGAEPPSGGAHLFRAEISEAVLVGLNERRDRLVVEWWRPGEPLQRLERE